jgi:hypothetical protein
MWFLVTVVKGSRHFDIESQIGNRVLISDTTDMVISGRTVSDRTYRFEVRKGNETFIVNEYSGALDPDALTARFTSMAQQMGAVIMAASP